MHVIILAQGAQTRWRNPACPYKHLLPVGGEPMLTRTVRLLEEAGTENITVVGFPHYKPCIRSAQLKTLAVPGWTLSGVLQSYEAHPRTIYLLGDVLFSRKAVEDILNCDKDWCFFGRSQPSDYGKGCAELFGFTFAEGAWDLIRTHSQWMLDNERKIHLDSPPKLWALYRLCCGFQHGDPQFLMDRLIEWYDYTNDIDTLDEYQLMWPKMEPEAILDK